MYAYLKMDRGVQVSSVYDPVSKENVFLTNMQIQVMVQQWQTIFSMHQHAPPDWEAFVNTYGHHFRPSTQAPTDLPAAEALHKRAQKAAELNAAGSDGWKPFELKALPIEAWVHRRRVLGLAADLGRYASSYYEVNTPGLPKKDKGTAPLDHRMLAIFSALYRIEAGAWYDHIFQRLRTILHKDMAGAIPGMEALDIAWDAQARIENALLNKTSLTMVSYDSHFSSSILLRVC